MSENFREFYEASKKAEQDASDERMWRRMKVIVIACVTLWAITGIIAALLKIVELVVVR